MTRHHFAQGATLTVCGQPADGVNHTTHGADVLRTLSTLEVDVDVCEMCLAVVLERDLLGPGRVLALSLDRLRQTVHATIADIVEHAPDGLTPEAAAAVFLDDEPDGWALGAVVSALGYLMDEGKR